MKVHKLSRVLVGSGECACGVRFRAYKSAHLNTDAKMRDEILDQFNAHRAALLQAGRQVE